MKPGLSERERDRVFKLYCSFCGKEKSEVAYLVAGPQVFICNECVVMAAGIGTTMLVENAVAATLQVKKG